jgi:hypothetical protein
MTGSALYNQRFSEPGADGAFYLRHHDLLDAALLFIVEPMVAKMILPYLGGSPAVWNTSLMFYQAWLLAGYAYAHFGVSWLGTRRHALLHLLLAAAALLVLPVTLPLDWLKAPEIGPVNLVLAVLIASVGFPFFVLSAGGPLLQKWFAQGAHRAARDPYFLYAASNTGSLAGLLAYPLLLEPRFTLSRQNQLWLAGYAALVILMALCFWCFLRPRSARAEGEERKGENAVGTPLDASHVTVARRLRWVASSFVPSSLLLGVTAYVTTDVASTPLFWVVPLGVYLLTFIIAFARPAWAANAVVLRLQALSLLAAAATIFLGATEPAWVILPLHLCAFLLTSLVCHGQLAKDRPEVRRLTEFYLLISVGGVLGGAFNALVAPTIFTGVVEYPLAMAAGAFIRPYSGIVTDRSKGRRLDWFLPPAALGLIVLVAFAMKQAAILPPANDRLLICGVAVTAFLAFAHRPVRFGVAVTAFIFVSFWLPSAAGRLLFADRSFFGSYRVTLKAEEKRRVLFQGTTVHGAQSTDERLRLEPLTYYHRTGPAGEVLKRLADARREGQVAIIGLGSGALACHGGPGQNYTFYEIDPMIEKIARDGRLFTYLRDCSPRVNVVIGDGRLSLAKAADRSYDAIVLDAFSSDVIPTHLLTQEALRLYLRKMQAHGILLVHISNRHMDLAPVVGRLAQSLSLVGYIGNDFEITPSDSAEGKSASRWIMLARGEKNLEPFLASRRWLRLDGVTGAELWTDDFTDLLKVIHWQ